MLEKICSNDLCFTRGLENDRVNTYLRVDDYDWMNYELKTKLITEQLGDLDITFEYFGSTFSFMTVIQKLNGNTKEYKYKYNSEIFRTYISLFMLTHVTSWYSTYAFNGEEIVLKFYNAVIENGELEQ